MQYKIINTTLNGVAHYAIYDRESKEVVDGAPTLLDARNLLRMYQ